MTSGSPTSLLEKGGDRGMVKLWHHFNDGHPESFFILESRLEVELIFKFPFLSPLAFPFKVIIFGGAYLLGIFPFKHNNPMN